MNDDDLFIQTLEDLHISLASDDEYEVLRASQLIRQLLLEKGSNSLVLRVNRTRRLRNIEYLAIPGTPPTSGTWYAADAISPFASSQVAAPVAFKWKHFLKMVVAQHGGYGLTVHHFIDYAAHVAGGVHKTDPRTGPQKALADLQTSQSGPGLTPVAATLRAIGKVILVGLDELRDSVLDVARFEGGPGIAIYTNIILAPMAGGEENYIFDIGSELERNRITCFLDAHGNLCVRVFDATGKLHLLSAGPPGGAYVYGEPLSLACEIGCRSDEVLVNVDARDWGLTRVYRGAGGPFCAGLLPIVVGSDMTGRCRSKMLSLEIFVYDNIPTYENRQNCRSYLATRLQEKEQRAIEFSPGSCLYANGHPNFPYLAGSGRALLAPSNERRGVLRIAPFAWPFAKSKE